MSKLKELYDGKYAGETWSLPRLRPDAISTNAYDDIARLLQREGNGGRLLDVGCGSGKLAMALGQQYDKVIGLDLSEVRIALAREMLAKHCPELEGTVEFLTGNGDEPLPFADREFDVVVLCAVIEHVVDVFGLMDEAARVCKQGGYVVVAVPNICYVRHICDLIRGRLPLTGIPTREIDEWRKHGWDGAHLHYFSKDSLATLLRHVGFEPEEWTGDGKWARLRRWRVNWVGGLTVRAKRR